MLSYNCAIDDKQCRQSSSAKWTAAIIAGLIAAFIFSGVSFGISSYILCGFPRLETCRGRGHFTGFGFFAHTVVLILIFRALAEAMDTDE